AAHRRRPPARVPRYAGAAMRTPYEPVAHRRVLCVSPRYAPSFGTFQYAYPFFGGRVRAFMPPQGLLVVAAYLPARWEVRFVDENVRDLTGADLRWADVVCVSGMHVQRPYIAEIVRRAHAAGRPVALGGPSASACPEYYPEVDLLHVGELGDATDRLIEHLDRHPGRPGRQLRFETTERLALHDFPAPAYDLVAIRRYFIASVQFSSGCPYTCEFCDIPELYGRNPRLKPPARLLAELDRIAAAGATSVYFVDDNFVGNQKAALELLPHLIAWQVENRYPLRLHCEATLNLARNERLLGLMREAGFITVFCGVETPEAHALRFISKAQNLQLPILEAIRRFNAHGMEVVAGIILGLDTDTEDTAERVLAFVEASSIPVLTINLLYALPKTPLWRRLAAEGRLLPDGDGESNVAFKLPYEAVIAAWARCVTGAYEPAAVYRRFRHNHGHTFPNRLPFPANRRRASWRNLLDGVGILSRVVWRIGVRGDYRRVFWTTALPALRAGKIEELIHTAIVSHHLIEFTRRSIRGMREAAFYAPARDARRASAG
ncbi:MAG: B12-binding domain-containing radical SAM protein, partial [Candidatus Rokuibacteriota bacterium]